MPPRPLPTIAGTVRCAVTGLTPSAQKWVNVHHMQYAGGASNPGITEITAMDALLFRLYSGTVFAGGSPWLDKCFTGVTVQQIDYTVLDGTSLGYTIVHAGAGIRTNSLPSETAPVLTLLTGRRGRRYRGRIFFPCPDTTSVGVTGQLTSTVTNAIVAQYAGMTSALAAIQWTPVVASYGHGTTNGVPTTWTPFATPVTATRMDANVDVQRRRKM
jgi:hypothetical protein